MVFMSVQACCAKHALTLDAFSTLFMSRTTMCGYLCHYPPYLKPAKRFKTSDKSMIFVQLIQAPDLTHLRVKNTSSGLRRIPILAPKLQSLKLRICEKVPELAGSLSAKLTSLVLALNSNKRSRTHQEVPELHQLSTHCPNLRHVSVYGCTLDKFILHSFKSLHR